MKPFYRVYTGVVNTVAGNAQVQETIPVTANKDFQLCQIRVWTANTALAISLQIMDTFTNENWQNRAFHITGVSMVNGIIPFQRVIQKRAEIMLTTINGTGAPVIIQVMFIGYDINPETLAFDNKKK